MKRVTVKKVTPSKVAYELASATYRFAGPIVATNYVKGKASLVIDTSDGHSYKVTVTKLPGRWWRE